MANHFRDLLPLTDRLRYVAWRVSGANGTFRCRLCNGPCLSIRPNPSRDFDTAYEIFLLRIYETGLARESVRRIVDLGGNIGFSCLFWCWNYPAANVLTFEPHPVHCELLRRHVRENRCENRVVLLPAAAAARSGEARLTDDYDSSTVIQGAASNPRQRSTLAIELVDTFETIGPEPVDILKIDIEGMEYEIMSDLRFDRLAARTRCVLLEWHQRQPHHRGATWCGDHLKRLGFRVERGRQCSDFGILRGVRATGGGPRLDVGRTGGPAQADVVERGY